MTKKNKRKENYVAYKKNNKYINFLWINLRKNWVSFFWFFLSLFLWICIWLIIYIFIWWMLLSEVNNIDKWSSYYIDWVYSVYNWETTCSDDWEYRTCYSFIDYNWVSFYIDNDIDINLYKILEWEKTIFSNDKIKTILEWKIYKYIWDYTKYLIISEKLFIIIFLFIFFWFLIKDIEVNIYIVLFSVLFIISFLLYDINIIKPIELNKQIDVKTLPFNNWFIISELNFNTYIHSYTSDNWYSINWWVSAWWSGVWWWK